MITKDDAIKFAEKEKKDNKYFSYEFLKKTDKYGYVFLFHVDDPSDKTPMPTGIPLVAGVNDNGLKYIYDEDVNLIGALYEPR
ncbi:hypothetical protein [Fibrobacter sp. UBA2449]|uniref:hypothetical protein n=1 Tax=Fibrobacter sp. UBA2449 TaxID=1946529 RepID=UPI0025B9D097|nr:hypothetical protein [Fibrobacter sp. UBA2449]